MTFRSSCIRSLPLAVAVLLLWAATASAQRISYRFAVSMNSVNPASQAVAPVIATASTGSALGVLGGWHLGGAVCDATGCCGGGDDPGLNGRIGLAAVMSVIGASAVPALLKQQDFSSAASAAAIGVLPATAAAIAGLALSDGSAWAGVPSYSIVHGIFVGVVAPHL